MQIGVIPLDERPVNTRFPAQIAQIAGAQVVVPPADLLSHHRQAAPADALAVWLRTAAPTLDALIVSVEMLGCGGLIASRIGHEPTAQVLQRLELLREVRQAYPALTLYGFNVITRIPAYDHAFEEPDYWGTHGRALWELSTLLDTAEATPQADALRAALPPAAVADFLRRRLRNHTVNLAAVGLLEDDTFALLVLSSDDTSTLGLNSREKGWLWRWGQLLALGDRLLMYPGADEVGSVLVARLLNARQGRTPRFTVVYADPAEAGNIAPYEDGPVRLTVERQIAAVGGGVAAPGTPADAVVMVNTPVTGAFEFEPDFYANVREPRRPLLAAFAREIGTRLAAGERVIVCDAAYPNGADPLLMECLLAEHIPLDQLTAYAGWNTAGNTIGTALAQACAAAVGGAPAEQQRFLCHRLVEDWGYQRIVRAAVRDLLEAETGSREVTPATQPQVLARIEADLQAHLAAMPAFGGRWRIVPGSVRLPWGRLFEVDFDLEEA